MSPQFGQVIPSDPLKAQPYRTQRAELPEDLKICQGPSLKNSVNSGKAVMLIPNQVLLRRKGVEAVYGADFRSEEMAHSLANKKLKKMVGNREPKIQRLKNLVNSVDPKILKNENHGNTEPSSTRSREGVEIKLENSPTKLARKLLLGTILGDSSLRLIKTRNPKKAYFRMTHANNQFEYLMWKAKKLFPLIGSFCSGEILSRITGHYKVRLKSLSSKYLKHIYDDFYFRRDGTVKKEVHSNILNRLTPISIAVLYGDDGYLEWRELLNGIRVPIRVVLSTQGFSFKESLLLCDFFKRRFGVNFIPISEKLPVIRASGYENIRKFLGVVSPYLSEIECMRYKIDPNYRKPSDFSARLHRFVDGDIIRASRKLEEMIRNNHPPN